MSGPPSPLPRQQVSGEEIQAAPEAYRKQSNQQRQTKRRTVKKVQKQKQQQQSEDQQPQVQWSPEPSVSVPAACLPPDPTNNCFEESLHSKGLADALQAASQCKVCVLTSTALDRTLVILKYLWQKIPSLLLSCLLYVTADVLTARPAGTRCGHPREWVCKVHSLLGSATRHRPALNGCPGSNSPLVSQRTWPGGRHSSCTVSHCTQAHSRRDDISLSIMRC